MNIDYGNVFCSFNRDDHDKIRDSCRFKREIFSRGNFGVNKDVVEDTMIKSNKFLTGLLGRVIDYCKNKNIPVEMNFMKKHGQLLAQDISLTGISLRPDQEKAIYQARTLQRGVIKAPTGSGKTVVAGGICASFPLARVLFLCHTLDLLTQTYDEFNAFGLKNVLMLGGGKSLCPQQIEQECIVVATIQTLHQLDPSQFKNFDMVIIDECFWANTKIRTKNSIKNISDIQIGDEVYTQNKVCKVTNKFINKISLNRLLKVSLSNNKTIYCSDTHLFYSENNTWVEAKNLKGKILFSFDEKFDMMSCITSKEGNEKNENTHCLQDLWNKIFTKISKTKILFKTMYVPRPFQTERNFRKNEKNERIYSQRKFRKNENKQPIQKPINNRKDKNNKKDQWDFTYLVRKTWRKWDTFRTSITSCFSSRVADGGCNSDRSLPRPQWIPNMLQSRYWEQRFKNWYRNRRQRALIESDKNTRSKKGTKIKRIKVENIEIYKRGSNDQSFIGIVNDQEKNKGYIELYDLEIESEHNYFAEDVLVHNCHHVTPGRLVKGKVIKSSYASFLESVNIPIRIGLTATPPNDQHKSLFVEGYLGPVIAELTIEEGMKMGIIAKPVVDLVPVPYVTRIGELKSYRDIYRQGVIENKTRNHLILEYAFDSVDKGLSVLILTGKETDHGHILKQMATEAFDRQIPFLYGLTSKEKRTEYKNLLKSRELKIAIANIIWYEGVNIPPIDIIINAEGGRASGKTLQKVGRGLRTSDGKTHLLVVDFLDPYKYLNHHCVLRLITYAEQGWLKPSF